MFGKKENKESAVAEREYKVVVPAVDISESEAGYQLRAEMPGVKKEDVEIAVENDVIEITAKADFKEEGSPLYREFGPVQYERRFKLGRDISSDGIVASVSQGLLSVTLPKSETAKRRSIHIE